MAENRVHVDVTRPRQTDSEGLRVPILYGSSPYYAGTTRDKLLVGAAKNTFAEAEPLIVNCHEQGMLPAS